MEIEQRLGLYQVFRKLYDHHRGLLDEILQLEDTGNESLAGMRPHYVQGIVQGKQVYLIANLLKGKTQILLQPQRVWTIGRDRHLAMPISDKRLSRRHAAIQYIENQGFYLVDLGSTNGSFVNGEPVYQRLLLKDGDRIRLSSLTFSFFLCRDTRILGDAPPELLAKLNTQVTAPALVREPDRDWLNSSEDWDTAPPENPGDTERFLTEQDSAPEPISPPVASQLTPARESKILDRFFQRHSTADEHN